MSILPRVVRKLRRHSLPEFFFGWLLARRFTSAGVVIVRAGSPRPTVINEGGEIHCGNCAFFPGVRLEVLKGGRIEIGDGTYLNRNTLIVSERDVRIGRDCKISWDVVIMDTDQHALPGSRGPQPVVIEDGAWIGCRAMILKGVRVGRGAIVGAGAIVTKDVPPGAVVTGPAAHVIAAGATADTPVSLDDHRKAGLR
jgi:acetyltransferase-like isoleucine patch superfamily enzyme